MKYKAVVFDMDGVIFDSERASYNEWLALAPKYGMENLEEVYPLIIGRNDREGKKIIRGIYGQDFPFDRFLAEKEAASKAKYGGGKMPLKPGIRELLEYLKEEGCYLAVASSTNSGIVRAQITDAGFAPYFSRIIGGDMVAKSKPEPDIFLEALKGTGILPEEAAVVEDSHNGVRAAYAAGMFPAMIPDMMPVTEEMKEKAGVILPDLLELKTYFTEAK